MAAEIAEQQTADNAVENGSSSEEAMGHQERLLGITNRVHAASNIDEILIDLNITGQGVTTLSLGTAS